MLIHQIFARRLMLTRVYFVLIIGNNIEKIDRIFNILDTHMHFIRYDFVKFTMRFHRDILGSEHGFHWSEKWRQEGTLEHPL